MCAATIFLDHRLLLPVVAQDGFGEAGTFGRGWLNRLVLLLIRSVIVLWILGAGGILRSA